jgi:uncharacterized protein with PIN domain
MSKQTTKTLKLMSQKEYLKHRGQRCPACGGQAVASDQPEVDAMDVWQNCYCEDCGAEWVDHYKLSGYDSFEPGQTDEEQSPASTPAKAG